MDKFGYMFITFTIVWLAMVIYILILGQKQKHLLEEITRLRDSLLQDK